MVNATDEEILEAGKKIVASAKEIKDYDLSRIKDEYLTDELKERKRELLESTRLNKIKNIEESIKKEQAKLRQLKK